MHRLRWRVGQGLSLLFMLPVEAGQPIIVLPQMLFPRGDDEAFHKAMRPLAITIESPLRRPVRSRDCRTQLISWRNGCSFSDAMV